MMTIGRSVIRLATVAAIAGAFAAGGGIAARADDAPPFAFISHPVPATTNPLGVKGCGEAGCAGAMPAVMNALIDALREFNITNLDMPATPEKVWAAIQEARHAKIG